MIPFKDAARIVMDSTIPAGTETTDLHDAAGRILACDLFSDIDMPPFPKSAVDGFAFLFDEQKGGNLPGNQAVLSVTGTIPAGKMPEMVIGPGECAKIMTGARIPEGANRVVMVEDTIENGDGTIRVERLPLSSNICRQGEDMKTGQLVLRAGTKIGPAEIAILAATGHISLKVARRPVVSVISTGDELVEPHLYPGGSQIRNSNGMQLMAQLLSVPVTAQYLGIAPDTPDGLRLLMEKGLSGDVTILTGGVSMGDYDYVPGVMKEMGFEILITKIAIQPGKPTVFARKDNHYIIGLPGNPVSSYVLFELLVRPFLLKLMGCDFHPAVLPLTAGSDLERKRGDRLAVIPVRIDGGLFYPVEYHGSAHINAYAHAHGMVMMEPGIRKISKGSVDDVRLL